MLKNDCPPSAINLAPLKFSSLEPLRGAPACACMTPYSSCWFIFFFLFAFLSLFFHLFFSSFVFPFLIFFGTPLVTRGAEALKNPPGYAPALEDKVLTVLSVNFHRWHCSCNLKSYLHVHNYYKVIIIHTKVHRFWKYFTLMMESNLWMCAA